MEMVATFAVYRGFFSVEVMGTGIEVGREGTIPGESRGDRVERVARKSGKEIEGWRLRRWRREEREKGKRAAD